MLFAIPFPVINPVLVDIGPFPIRWYALAYIAGLVLGWAYACLLVSRESLWRGLPRPTAASIGDLLTYAAIGVVVGGRLGYVLFYNLDFFLAHPTQVVAVWKGGMSFHGGLLGASLGVAIFARRATLKALTVFDLCAAAAPIGLFLGRLANFIKPELWGRQTDVAWAMIFPGAGDLPRHPSQIYEATLEGVVLFVLLALVVRAGGLRRPGLVTGVFAVGYGVARIASEFFREPDPQLGFLFGGATMGMLLSLPLIAVGLVCLVQAVSRPTAVTEPST